MKTLENFLSKNPSYVKWGAERLAQKTGISLNTVKRFKNSTTFKSISQNYRNNSK